MSKLDEIRQNWNNPFSWPRAAKKFASNRIIWGYYQLNKNKGIRVMEADWDTLIILDGCRYDMFEEINEIKGELEHRYSRGSCTPDFIRENFLEGEFHDTVYVTANPMYCGPKFEQYDIEERFYNVIDVWQAAWDDELGTIKPKAVMEAAIKAFDDYPNKRHLVHFMQPHRPFIGDKGKQIEAQKGMTTRNKIVNKNDSNEGERAWKLVDQNRVSVEQAWEAYNENLEEVLPYAEKVVNHHNGKRVISSDHGNLVDEPPFPLFQAWNGHPPRTWTDELVKVPWLVIEDSTRRSITAEDTRAELKSNESGEVEQRLRDLGYTT
jgi:hypothetical protein